MHRAPPTFTPYMLEQLKTLMNQQARGQPAEFVYSLTPEVRSAILLDLRYVTRDTARARQLPMLLLLIQTVERNNTRIRFPAGVLAKLAREIEQIRDKLPEKSPLIELADGAREHMGEAALLAPGITAPGPASITENPSAAAKPARSEARSAPPINPPAEHGQVAAAPARASSVRGVRPATLQPKAAGVVEAAAPAVSTNTNTNAGEAKADGSVSVSGAAPADAAASAPEARLSAGEEAQHLRRAADKVEVNYVTTVELGDNALAGYLTYCLSLGEYEKIAETLIPRVEQQPCVWAWNLLVTSMRLGKNPEFSAYAKRYHAWLEEVHPETIADPGAEHQRKFSMEKIAALEREELGEA